MPGSKSAVNIVVSDNSDEDIFAGYDPTVRSSSSKRPTPVRDRRPVTSDPKPQTFIEDFGEIDMKNSRRRGRVQTERPTTSPGAIQNIPPSNEFKPIKTSIEESPREDPVKTESKGGLPPKKTMLRLETFNEGGESNPDTSKKSGPAEENKGLAQSTFREGQDPQVSARDTSLDKQLDKFAAMPVTQKTGVNKLDISPLGTPLHQTLKEEKNISTMLTPNMEKQLQFMFPNPNDQFVKNYLRETEEMYKKRIKEMEEYYEQRHQALKNAIEQERKQMEDYLKRESELMKKEKDEFKESMNNLLEQERARMKELFRIEMESKEKVHKYEMERQKHVYEEQYKTIKQQFESQAKLNSLADEIRMSSTKIMVLSDKLESGKILDERTKEVQLLEKEKELREKEMWIQHEKQMLAGEKSRLEKAKAQIEEKEAEMEKTLEKERSWIKSEYARLTALQESMNNFEEMKRKEIEKEKKALQEEKLKFEKDKIELLRELKEKNNEVELKMKLFEEKRKGIEDILQKGEKELKERQEEVEEIRRLLLIQQQEMNIKIKEIQEKERDTLRKANQIEEKMEILDRELKYVEKEKKEVLELNRMAKENAELVNQMQHEKDLENEKLRAIKFELDQYAEHIRHRESSLEREKQDILQTHKSLQEARVSQVKDFSQSLGHQPRKSMQELFSIMNTQTERKKEGALTHKRAESAYSGKITFRPSSNVTSSNVPSTTISRNASMVGLHSKRSSMDYQADPLGAIKDYKKIELSSNKTSLTNLHSPVRKTTRGFDLFSYMNELKRLEKHQDENMNYILSQRDSLLKDQVGLESEKANLLMSGMSEYTTTLTSSRLKASK